LDLRERWTGVSLSAPDRKRLWFHAASLGEWQGLKPLLARFVSEGNFSLVVTTSAPEVRSLIKKAFPELSVSLLPIDLWWVVGRWIEKVRPHAVVILETELWPNLIEQLSRKNVPVFLANGRLSKKSVSGWRWVKPFIRRTLRDLTVIFARTEEDASRFAQLGAYGTSLEIQGNMKSDTLTVSTREQKKEAKRNLLGLESQIVLIGGSTWPSEEELILHLFLRKDPQFLRVILAPRRLERLADIRSRVTRAGHTYSLWSEIKSTHSWTTDVLLVDTFGDLKELYRASDIAFIGGSVYPRGGQNPLEPAAARLSLLFGPHMDNFSLEARKLLEAGAAFTFKTELEFTSHASSLFHEGSLSQQMGDSAANVVLLEQGASERVYSRLKDLLSL
jgi:3-deoxy-D-manno-octulosonic-acid transferase